MLKSNEFRLIGNLSVVLLLKLDSVENKHLKSLFVAFDDGLLLLYFSSDKLGIKKRKRGHTGFCDQSRKFEVQGN